MKHLTRIGIVFLAACIVVSYGGCSKNQTADESAISSGETTAAATSQSTTTETANTTTETPTSAETTTTAKTATTTAATEPAATETEAVTEATTTETDAQTVLNTKAYQAFQAAAEKSITTDSIDMNFSFKSYDGNTELLSFSGNFQAISQNNIINTMSADLNMSYQAEPEQISYYYADGIAYENMNGTRYKHTESDSMTYSDITSFLSSSGVAYNDEFSESDFYDTTIVTEGDITTITVSLTSENAQKLLNSSSLSDGTSVEMPDTTMVFCINEQGYLTKISITCKGFDTSTDSPYEIDFSMEIKYPGQGLVIKAPDDLDEYVESSDTTSIF